MANFLAGASTLSQQVITAGVNIGASAALYGTSQIANLQPNQIANAGINAAFSIISGQSIGQALSGAASSLIGIPISFGGIGGGLKGTKPVPLYTERAGSEASGDKPYSFDEDIEFFLLRADQSAPAASVQEETETEEAAVPATTQTGGNFLGDALKSPFGQLAVGLAVNTALSGVQTITGGNSLVAPLTGLAVSAGLRAATGTGIFSQSAANAAGGTPSAVYNAVATGPDPFAATSQLSLSSYWAPSAEYFTNTAAASFAGGTDAFTTDPFQYPTSDLGGSMGSAFPSIVSDETLAESINEGGLAGIDFATGTSLNLAPALETEDAPPLNEDATTIQNKDTLDDIPKSWYFITAPQDASWSKEGRVGTADTYGTNTPYVLYGSTSLRKLTLSNAMLEGFSDRKTVEANIVALETCMNMVIQKGYTAPYCWKVYSGGKSYGTFILTGVKVKEVMRDLRGFATRAFVDLELQQVPDYQVNSGRDLASKATLGGVSKEVQTLIDSQNKDTASKEKDKAAGKSGDTAAQTKEAGAQDSKVQQVQGGSGARIPFGK